MTVESTFGSAPSPAYDRPEVTGLAAPTSSESSLKAFDDADGPSFSDLLDVINPLQHIPIINTIYQHLTDDKEGAVADVLGGALWGGVIGLGAAVANLIVEDSTGKSVGDHVYALFSDDDGNRAIAKTDGDKTNQSAVAKDAAPASQNQPTAKIFDLGNAKETSSSVSQPSGGPIVAGDFLVFGNAASAAPAATAGNGKASAVAGNSTGGTPVQSGDFLVFGKAASTDGDTPAASSNTAAAASPQPLTPAADAAAPSVAAQTAAVGTQPTRSFAGPLRRTTATPPQTLPMPTTGPAAVPGRPRNASTTRAVANETDSAWFTNAFNGAMDKYNRAANLGTPAAAKGTGEGETANSVLRMN